MNKALTMIPPVMYSETITGTQQENVVASELKQILRDIGVDDVKLYPVNVMTWIENECRLETSEGSIKCHALPYSLSADIEAPIVYAGYAGDKIYVDESVDGRIVLIPFPEDPDDAKYVMLKLFMHGAVAIIFFDEAPGRYRRIVVTGVQGFPYEKGLPPLIPVVNIKKEDLLFLRKKLVRKLRLYVKTRVLHDSTGYNVLATINGGREEVLVTAHHDHWFTGFSDDLLGLDTILKIAQKLVKKRVKRTVKIVSFTAEESGAPNYAGWYWSWGSRCYVKDRYRSLDEVYAVINIDGVFASRLRISSNPCFYDVLSRISMKYGIPVDNIELDSPYFDSFMFTLNGVPALTIHTLPELRLNYHTNLDDGEEVSIETITLLNKFVEDLVYTIGDNDVHGVEGFYREVYKNLHDYENAPLEARILLNKFKQLVSSVDKLDLKKTIRLLSKKLIRAYVVHGIEGVFSSIFIPPLLYIHLAKTLYKNTDGVFIEDVYIAGEEKLLIPGVKKLVSDHQGGLYGELKGIYMRMFVSELAEINRVFDEIVMDTIKH